MRSNQKGFTLVELMIVIAIIGIIAAISIPKFQQMLDRSRASDQLKAEGIHPTPELITQRVNKMHQEQGREQFDGIQTSSGPSEHNSQSHQTFTYNIDHDHKFVDIKAGHSDSYTRYIIVTKRRNHLETNRNEYKVEFMDNKMKIRNTITVREQ